MVSDCATQNKPSPNSCYVCCCIVKCVLTKDYISKVWHSSIINNYHIILLIFIYICLGLFSFIFPLLLLIIITAVKVLWKIEKGKSNNQNHSSKNHPSSPTPAIRQSYESHPTNSTTISQEDQQSITDNECFIGKSDSSDYPVAVNRFPMSSSSTFRKPNTKSYVEDRITSTTIEETNKEQRRRDYFQTVNPSISAEESCEQVIIDNQESSCLNWNDMFQNLSNQSGEERSNSKSDIMNKMESHSPGKDTSTSASNSSNRNSSSRRVIISNKIPRHELSKGHTRNRHPNRDSQRVNSIDHEQHDPHHQQSISSEQNLPSGKNSSSRPEYSSQPIHHVHNDSNEHNDGQVKWDRVQQWVEEERHIDRNEWIKEEDWETIDPGKDSSEFEPELYDEYSYDSRSVTSSNSSANHKRLLRELHHTSIDTQHTNPQMANHETLARNNSNIKQRKIVTHSSFTEPVATKQSNENQNFMSKNVTITLSKKVPDRLTPVTSESISSKSRSDSSSRNSKIPRRIDNINDAKKPSHQHNNTVNDAKNSCSQNYSTIDNTENTENFPHQQSIAVDDAKKDSYQQNSTVEDTKKGSYQQRHIIEDTKKDSCQLDDDIDDTNEVFHQQNIDSDHEENLPRDCKELRHIINNYFVDSEEMVELGRKIINFVTAKSKISTYPEFDDVELALNRMCHCEIKDEQKVGVLYRR